MRLDSELRMAVCEKFNSILDEVQQSKLNYHISLTPFAAYITLKKSTQVELDGKLASPSPPLLRLLEQSLREKFNYESEINLLKTTLLKSESQCDQLSRENRSLLDQISSEKEHLDQFKEENDAAKMKLDLQEKEILKLHVEKKNLADKLSKLEKQCQEIVCDSDREVKALKKSIKCKEKELHNLTSKLDNFQDTNSNLKYDLSQSKSVQSSLTADLRKIEQKMKKLQCSKSTHCVSVQTAPTIDTPYNVTDSLPPIFGSQLCLRTKPVFLSKSLPDLSKVSWVLRTEEDVLGELEMRP